MNKIAEMNLPEIINMGIFDAELTFNGIKATLPREVAAFEIEIPLQDGGLSYINHKTYPIRNDCIICAKPGQIRYTVLPFKCYYVHMHINKGTLYEYLIKTPDTVKTFDNSKYIKLFRSIIAANCSPCEGSELFIQSKVLELIYLIHTDTQHNSKLGALKNNIDINLILKALSFLDNHYNCKITLEDVAKSINLSPIYFHKLFSQTTGQTPYEYILEKRLNAAKDLLLFSNKSFTEIAFECGFSSQSYFNYVFKKEIGTPPKQYKRNVYDKYPIT